MRVGSQESITSSGQACVYASDLGGGEMSFSQCMPRARKRKEYSLCLFLFLSVAGGPAPTATDSLSSYTLWDVTKPFASCYTVIDENVQTIIPWHGYYLLPELERG